MTDINEIDKQSDEYELRVLIKRLGLENTMQVVQDVFPDHDFEVFGPEVAKRRREAWQNKPTQEEVHEMATQLLKGEEVNVEYRLLRTPDAKGTTWHGVTVGTKEHCLSRVEVLKERFPDGLPFKLRMEKETTTAELEQEWYSSESKPDL